MRRSLAATGTGRKAAQLCRSHLRPTASVLVSRGALQAGSMRPDTLLVHAGEPRPRAGGAVAMPIYQSSTFEETAWRKAVGPRTKLFYLESMTNPLVRIGDLPAAAAFARERGLVSVIDNTFATPLGFRPLRHGFDLAVHSATKYLNGHSDLIA